jgi:hypothetical protein
VKAMSFVRGKVCDGIELTLDNRLGPIIFLGEEGRGCRYEKVSLSRRHPACVVSGKVHDCHPEWITVGQGQNERSFLVLSKPRNPQDPRALVRVCTYGRFARDTCGYWEALRGNPITIVSGYGAYGYTRGRITWDDGLVLMAPGDVIEVRLADGDPQTLVYDLKKGLFIRPFSEVKTAVALPASAAAKEATGAKIAA